MHGNSVTLIDKPLKPHWTVVSDDIQAISKSAVGDVSQCVSEERPSFYKITS